MSGCPKCGGWHISGPHYHRDTLGGEWLRYTCCRCGYSKNEPTKDSRK